MSVKATLLQALFTGPGYGLELIERVRRRTGGRVRLRQGSLYPALRELEGEGLVGSWEIPPPGGRGRPRRYCELTPRGVVAAEAEREAIARLVEPDDPRPSPPRRELARMRERFLSFLELTAFCAELSRAGQAGRRGA